MSEIIDMGCSDVLLEVIDNIAVLRLQRPKVNALTEAMQDACGQAAVIVNERQDIAALVITGGERAFAAGVDIPELAASDYARMSSRVVVMHESYSRVAACNKPVIAAVNGFALGGGFELALCADIRIYADNVQCGFPEVKLGIIPGAGGTQRLARLVGTSRAKDIIFTGRFVKADEALAMGIANQVVAADQVEATAIAYARQFVGQAMIALTAAKRAIDDGSEVELQAGLAIERAHFTGLFLTEDKNIGMDSFQKNGPGKAIFVGR
ncbi:MAG: enoyl-CoA hydratase/isomerase family protein [Propionibacteriaceae bacterium]